MIPLYKPYIPKELPELDKILHSGSLSYGLWSKKFEKKLSLFLDVKNLIATNTYSNAIYVALSTIGLLPDDEVIASPMSCLASNQPLLTYGLKIKWADIDPKTGTLDPDSVEKCISPKTKLIFHNHFCGYVGHVDEINNIGKKYNIPVIDDCIEAFGSKYNDKYTGNLGTDITVFSFQTVRLPNTIDGGAIVFNDKELYDKALLIRDYGIRREKFRDEYGEISPDCDIYLPGYGATLSDVNGYIGCVQMDDIQLLLNRQQNNANYWNSIIYKYPVSPFNFPLKTIPNYWVYGCFTHKKNEAMLKFRNDGFYASGVHIPNSYYSIFDNNELKGVTEFYKNFLAIPCGWWFENKEH